ncbi:MAG: gliding motility-associated C-terminal domain-containing protein [Flavobacteriales bacterium]|nr:gliding motility-associated C-terminal domain-containing protein [Flavobacteriales bacterium]
MLGESGGGQFGYDNTNGNQYVYPPVQVASDVIDIMAGETFSYILKSDGTLWCSGGACMGCSIWLNLPDESREEFTKLTPENVPGACGVLATNAAFTPVKDCDEKGSITIYSSGGKPPYQYSIGAGFQTSNVFYGVNEGTYYITVLDANNCETNTTVNVSSLLNEPCIKPLITVPNVFTPNGDELNNVFKIKTENIKYLHCQIYNRWGTKMYEWEDIEGFWNGKNFKEKDCSVGTYYYVIRYVDLLDKTESLSGYITLLRN